VLKVDSGNSRVGINQTSPAYSLDVTGTARITGDLTVQGTTTTIESAAVNTSLIFEGATADSYETTLTLVDPTADRTITLPDSTGTVALTGGASTAITVADTTDTTCFVGLFESATGDLAPKTDGGATYNAGTGVLTATGFAGPLTGAVTGNADTATNSTTVTVADTTDTTCSVALFESATGDLGPKSDAGITYNAGTGMLTATGLTGPLTGNAATATEATNVTATANNSTDETVYPTFVDGATSTQGIETDTGLTYNPSTGVLTSAGFTGAVIGNVTGNASGTALTVTQAAQTAITSVGTLTSLTVSGGLVAPLAINPQTGTTYTFVLADAGKMVTSSNGSAQTLTVPPNSSVAYATGTQIIVQAIGSGTATLAEGSGVTINSKDDNKDIDGQYAAATLIKTATNVWSLIGALA
jgi:hypothetical protein